MKHINLSIALTVLLITSSYADINFYKGTWKEAVEMAKASNKMIFVDFYATWCGPCKYMSKKVFTDPEVSKIYNEKFVALKIDGEHEEQELVKQMNLQAYPTLAYYDSNGKLLLVNIGAMEVPEMLEKVNIISNFEKNKQAYEADPKNKTALVEYLLVLKQLDPEQARKLADDHISSLQDHEVAQDENWHLITRFVSDYNSREFKIIVENPELFLNKQEEFGEFYKSGMKHLMMDAIRNRDYSLVERHKYYHVKAFKAFKAFKFPEDYYFSLIDMMYYDGTKDEDMYLKTVTAWLDKHNRKNPVIIGEYVQKMADKVTKPANFQIIEKYAQKAIKLDNNSYTNYVYSYLMLKSGNQKQALEFAEKAKKKSKDENTIERLSSYIEQIKQM